MPTLFGKMHASAACRGTFNFKVFRDVMYQFNSIEHQLIPEAHFVVCDVCGASFFAPGFIEKVERNKAIEVATEGASSRGLGPRAVRFVRITLGLGQPQLAALLGLSITAYQAAETVGKLSPESALILLGLLEQM